MEMTNGRERSRRAGVMNGWVKERGEGGKMNGKNEWRNEWMGRGKTRGKRVNKVS